MSDLVIKDRFPIPPEQTSMRLFFAKENEFATIWHLCDAALGSTSTATGILYVALHGARMHVAVKADTVLQADLKRGLSDSFCDRCFDEYQLAVDLIREKRLLKFE